MVMFSEPEPEGGHAEREVLRSLPRSRPRIESPRRARARAAAEDFSGASQGDAQQASRSELEQLEHLAQAGVRVAGGAAAAGLKLAGRAVGGLGRVVGRH
jgi:hypothetical protein